MSEMVKEMSGGIRSLRGTELCAAFRRQETAGAFAVNCRLDARSGHGRRKDFRAREETGAADILMGGGNHE